MRKLNKKYIGEIYDTKGNLLWKVNTGGLLNEILSNNSTAILKIPLKIFAGLLVELGERASEINDPKLNAIMCRLAIYAESDPCNKDYNSQLTNKTIKKAYS